MFTTIRTAALVTAGLLALPAVGQTSEKTAGQTVVLPSLGGKNPEIKIAGEDILPAETTGPEIAYTAQLVQWEEGRSVTVRLQDGTTRVVPVANSVIFPADLRPGADVTFLVRQTADGRFRVMGMMTGGGGAPPPAPAQPAAPPAAPQVVPATAPVASEVPPTPPPRGKTVVGASSLSAAGTVVAYEEGKSITIKLKKGDIREIAIAEGAKFPENLAVGEAVVLRIPLQRPFDGKTTDRIERPKPKGTPIPSKFKAAQSPKS